MFSLEEVFKGALQKFQAGEMKHGKDEPETDTRDLLHEAEDEILGATDYLAMFLDKLRSNGYRPCQWGNSCKSDSG